MNETSSEARKLGLLGATSVGVGAIVGGGILALAGTAFAATGPSAMLAFAINGVIAIITALSFAEMASRFPESGGIYIFSRKVLSVDAAFCVGWVAWFASIVAAMLYAIGLAHFVLIAVGQFLVAEFSPAWLTSRWAESLLAVAMTLALTGILLYQTAGGGSKINILKLAVFLVLIAAGWWTVARQPVVETTTALKPFFANGFAGLMQAMGSTFIALQGFDLIAAVGGEVRNPARVIPRAMVGSLIIALAIYLPLLFVISVTGAAPGVSIQQAATADPEGIVAVAARNFLGPVGFWMVIVAAILSMFSALYANLFAASRICMAMAQDRTLPAALAMRNVAGNPAGAVLATGALVTIILFIVPDVPVAGAVSSLIFLVTFALAQWIAILIRRRTSARPATFQTPWFPLVPVAGGLACLGLAIFQGIATPMAGVITICWLSIGTMLFLLLFAIPARVRQTTESAINPELVRLRGRSPLALVPITNPENADSLIALAGALVPPGIGRVVIQHVLVASLETGSPSPSSSLQSSSQVVARLLETAVRVDVRAEILVTIAPRPMEEIARVAKMHRCHAIVMGLSKIAETEPVRNMEQLLANIETDVVVFRGGTGDRWAGFDRVLVPVAGRGQHEFLLAKLLGSLNRTRPRDVTFLRVLPASAKPVQVAREKRKLRRLAEDRLNIHGQIQVVLDDDPATVIADASRHHDLLVLGAHRDARGDRVLGSFTLRMAGLVECPLIVISSQG